MRQRCRHWGAFLDEATRRLTLIDALQSGVDGGWSSSRNLDAAYREDMTLQSILRTIYPCTIPKGGKP